MQKKFINQYKFRRKLKRTLSDGVGKSAQSPGKDFAWHKSKVNPYYQDARHRWRTFQIITLIAACLGTLVAGIYHPFFRVSDILVRGAERISATEITQAIEGMMNYRTWLVLPRNSYFLVNTTELSELLLERYPFSTVEAVLSFPHTLTVTVQEKLSTVIYSDSKEYSFVGTDGNIVEPIRKVGDDEWSFTVKITSSTDSTGKVTETSEKIPYAHIPNTSSLKKDIGEYPVIIDGRIGGGEKRSSTIPPAAVEAIIDWYHAFSPTLKTSFAYARLENEAGDLTLVSSTGFEIRSNMALAIDRQIKALELILKKRGGTGGLSYIDLRYPERVYWQ